MLELSEEDEKDIRAFVAWVYAGDFRSCHADLPDVFDSVLISSNCVTIVMRL